MSELPPHFQEAAFHLDRLFLLAKRSKSMEKVRDVVWSYPNPLDVKVNGLSVARMISIQSEHFYQAFENCRKLGYEDEASSIMVQFWS